MLSDKSIIRDKNYSIWRRILLKARNKVSVLYREKLNNAMSQTLKDIDFTVFSNNCLAGVFYHDAKKQFTSPLINTAMDGEDFIKFLERPEHYINYDKFEFFEFPGHNYPLAKIDDIEVRFVHYKTEEECIEKWKTRSKRIVWDNIFIVCTNHDGLGQEKWMERFDKLPYKNKIMFVSKEYPQYDWAIFVPNFKNRFQVRIMTNFANFRGQRYYETCFNIPEWIKENSKRP